MREKRFNRQPSGPGRSTKRTRNAIAPEASQTHKPLEVPRASPLARAAARIRRPKKRLGLTRRALVFFAVLAVLGLSFAGSLRAWIVQSNELATARTQIEERTTRITELEQELNRWEDPAYVTTQARMRLGWVMPGEVGYRVVGADGQVLSGTEAIEGVGSAQGHGLEARWWDKLTTSLHQADEPPPPTR